MKLCQKKLCGVLFDSPYIFLANNIVLVQINSDSEIAKKNNKHFEMPVTSVCARETKYEDQFQLRPNTLCRTGAVGVSYEFLVNYLS